MKKTLITLTLCGLTLIAKAQNTSVEKSTFGLQTGVLGIWAYNEAKLSNTLALRTEIGFDFGIWESTYYDDYDSPFLLTPVIVVEPRFYYNLEKRSKNSKRIEDPGPVDYAAVTWHKEYPRGSRGRRLCG